MKNKLCTLFLLIVTVNLSTGYGIKGGSGGSHSHSYSSSSSSASSSSSSFSSSSSGSYSSGGVSSVNEIDGEHLKGVSSAGTYAVAGAGASSGTGTNAGSIAGAHTGTYSASGTYSGSGSGTNSGSGAGSEDDGQYHEGSDSNGDSGDGSEDDGQYHEDSDSNGGSDISSGSSGSYTNTGGHVVSGSGVKSIASQSGSGSYGGGEDSEKVSSGCCKGPFPGPKGSIYDSIPAPVGGGGPDPAWVTTGTVVGSAPAPAVSSGTYHKEPQVKPSFEESGTSGLTASFIARLPGPSGSIYASIPANAVHGQGTTVVSGSYGSSTSGSYGSANSGSYGSSNAGSSGSSNSGSYGHGGAAGSTLGNNAGGVSLTENTHFGSHVNSGTDYGHGETGTGGASTIIGQFPGPSGSIQQNRPATGIPHIPSGSSGDYNNKFTTSSTGTYSHGASGTGGSNGVIIAGPLPGPTGGIYPNKPGINAPSGTGGSSGYFGSTVSGGVTNGKGSYEKTHSSTSANSGSSSESGNYDNFGSVITTSSGSPAVGPLCRYIPGKIDTSPECIGPTGSTGTVAVIKPSSGNSGPAFGCLNGSKKDCGGPSGGVSTSQSVSSGGVILGGTDGSTSYQPSGIGYPTGQYPGSSPNYPTSGAHSSTTTGTTGGGSNTQLNFPGPGQYVPVIKNGHTDFVLIEKDQKAPGSRLPVDKKPEYSVVGPGTGKLPIEDSYGPFPDTSIPQVPSVGIDSSKDSFSSGTLVIHKPEGPTNGPSGLGCSGGVCGVVSHSTGDTSISSSSVNGYGSAGPICKGGFCASNKPTSGSNYDSPQNPSTKPGGYVIACTGSTCGNGSPVPKCKGGSCDFPKPTGGSGCSGGFCGVVSHPTGDTSISSSSVNGYGPIAGPICKGGSCASNKPTSGSNYDSGEGFATGSVLIHKSDGSTTYGNDRPSGNAYGPQSPSTKPGGYVIACTGSTCGNGSPVPNCKGGSCESPKPTGGPGYTSGTSGEGFATGLVLIHKPDSTTTFGNDSPTGNPYRPQSPSNIPDGHVVPSKGCSNGVCGSFGQSTTSFTYESTGNTFGGPGPNCAGGRCASRIPIRGSDASTSSGNGFVTGSVVIHKPDGSISQGKDIPKLEPLPSGDTQPSGGSFSRVPIRGPSEVYGGGAGSSGPGSGCKGGSCGSSGPAGGSSNSYSSSYGSVTNVGHGVDVGPGNGFATGSVVIHKPDGSTTSGNDVPSIQPLPLGESGKPINSGGFVVVQTGSSGPGSGCLGGSCGTYKPSGSSYGGNSGSYGSGGGSGVSGFVSVQTGSNGPGSGCLGGSCGTLKPSGSSYGGNSGSYGSGGGSGLSGLSSGSGSKSSGNGFATGSVLIIKHDGSTTSGKDSSGSYNSNSGSGSSSYGSGCSSGSCGSSGGSGCSTGLCDHSGDITYGFSSGFGHPGGFKSGSSGGSYQASKTESGSFSSGGPGQGTDILGHLFGNDGFGGSFSKSSSSSSSSSYSSASSFSKASSFGGSSSYSGAGSSAGSY